MKRLRRRQAERDTELEAAHAESEEAMQALDELKRKHPKEVKTATSKERRPNLRRAYMRREAATAVGSEG